MTARATFSNRISLHSAALDSDSFVLDSKGFRRARVVIRPEHAPFGTYDAELRDLRSTRPSLDTIRFIEQFAAKVCVADPRELRIAEQELLAQAGAARRNQLDPIDLRDLTDRYLRAAPDFPRSVMDQLRALRRRHGDARLDIVRIYDLDDRGFAGSGVYATFDPSSGAAGSVHYWPGVATDALRIGFAQGPGSAALPASIEQCLRLFAEESAPHGSAWRFEFSVVGERAFVEHAAPLELSARARVAVALAHPEQLAAVTPAHIAELTQRRFAPAQRPPVGEGTGVAPGAFAGALVTSLEEIEQAAGAATVFVAPSPGPHNVACVLAADASMFATGGLTSHVAVIARGAGKPCVMGVDNLVVTPGRALLNNESFTTGDILSIDATNGRIYAGALEFTPNPAGRSELKALLGYCDARARVKVYANADTAEEAELAFAAGARGIGLCRIEHLASRPPALAALREVLRFTLRTLDLNDRLLTAERDDADYSRSPGASAVALAARHSVSTVEGYDRFCDALRDFSVVLGDVLRDIVRVAGSRPVVVRLLDAPMREFLTTDDLGDAASHHLYDSMLGLRGIRLLLVAPPIAQAHATAIASAAAHRPEPVDVMAPMVASADELVALRRLIAPAFTHHQPVRLGTMIETPRAALTASEIARAVDFVSFGTNDLAQFTWACSRDQAATAFMNHAGYESVAFDPFERFDLEGVGALVEMAARRLRATAPDLPIGVCGELALQPAALGFLQACGVDYLSCATQNVPAARLVAGQLA